MPYTYTIAEDNKRTGTYTVTVTYTVPTGANGDAAYSTTTFLPVYRKFTYWSESILHINTIFWNTLNTTIVIFILVSRLLTAVI